MLENFEFLPNNPISLGKLAQFPGTGYKPDYLSNLSSYESVSRSLGLIRSYRHQVATLAI